MSEVNKINSSSSGNPFDVRVNQPSPDRRQQRETTVNDQETSQGRQKPASPQPKKPAEKTRESSAMDEMLEALRAQQNLEEDAGEYVDRRKEFYRESNRQASEAYIRNLKEVGKEQAKEVIKDRSDTSDTHAVYQSRIQDISRAHIEKLIKSKLDSSTFKDTKRIVDPDDPNDTDDDAPQPKLARPDNSRLRPELSKLLASRRTDAFDPPDKAKPDQPGQTEESGQTEEPGDRNLLESAISKLKNRLGGAHKGIADQLKADFQPVLGSDANYAQARRDTPAPVRTDLNQFQESILRARALRASADGSMYVPLEDADVHKLLVENKLPVDYSTVQAIKMASRRMRDSSFYFHRAVTILVHSGLGIDAETTEMVAGSLRQYEKYQRPSIMNKLFRYITTKKYMQLYHQLRAHESFRQNGGQMELGEALDMREATSGRSRTAIFPKVSREQLQNIHKQVRAEGLNLPEEVDEPTLKAGIRHLLKEVGLPASKVMVNQLAQSAQGNTLRAQALVFQLASRRSLHPDEISQLQQRLADLPAADRSLAPSQLMLKLGLPLPQAQSGIRGDDEAIFKTILRQLGLNQRQLDGQPLTREAILLLHELGERTETLQQMIPKLAEAIRRQPEFWIKRLAEHQPRLMTLVAGEPGKMPPEKKTTFVQSLLLALELPATRIRAMNLLERLMNTSKSTSGQTVTADGQIVTVNGETVATRPADAKQPAPGTEPDLEAAPASEQEAVPASDQEPDQTTEQMKGQTNLQAGRTPTGQPPSAQAARPQAPASGQVAQDPARPQTTNQSTGQAADSKPLTAPARAALFGQPGPVVAQVGIEKAMLMGPTMVPVMIRKPPDYARVAALIGTIPSFATSPVLTAPSLKQYTNKVPQAGGLWGPGEGIPASAPAQPLKGAGPTATLQSPLGPQAGPAGPGGPGGPGGPQLAAAGPAEGQSVTQSAAQSTSQTATQSAPIGQATINQVPTMILPDSAVPAEPGAPAIRPGPAQPLATAAASAASAATTGLAGSGSPAEADLAAELEPQLRWAPELDTAYPLAREALLVLRLQAQRTDQLSALVSKLAPLLKSQPQALLQQLERMAPTLQEWRQSPTPKAETLLHLLGQLEKAVRPQSQASSGPSQGLSGPLLLPEHQLERTLQRFYPGLSPKGQEQALKQLLGASPALMDGFYQLHRLLSLLDPGKAQSLAGLWEQPQIYSRLAQLGPVLAPVLEAVALSPERRYLAPVTQQNQLVQALQTWLLQGRPEVLQSALQTWLQPMPAGRSPLGKLKEQLAGFGLQQLPETLLDEIWNLSEGSADKIDVMGLLLRGGYPLLRSNIQVLQPYLEQLPPQWRRQGISDILMHFSPQLLKLIDRELDHSSELGKLGTLLEHDLPLLPENWPKVEPHPGLPDFARGLQLGELKSRLELVQQHHSGPPAEDLTSLITLIDRLQTQLRVLAAPAPAIQAGIHAGAQAGVPPLAELKVLNEICRSLLACFPQSLGQPAGQTAGPGQPVSTQLPTQNPAQSWVQLLQASPAREQPVLLMQLQDQISGLFYQLKTLLPRIEQRSEPAFEAVTPHPDRIAAPPQPPNQALDPSLEEIAVHLQNWGIKANSPALLQQIQQLMAGDPQRLDAMAVLLKGQMPLLPAHIEIVSQYVRMLPPHERFTSISKILSFLSDELIAHMQQELGERRLSERRQAFPGLEPDEAEAAENLLDETPRPLTEQKLQAARLLVNSPLPQQTGTLQAIGQLLSGRPQPQHWLGPLQSLIGQMQSLLPMGESTPAQAAILAQLQESLAEVQNLLQPRSSQLGNWMMGVGSQLANVSSRISEQVRSLNQNLGSEEHWLGQLLSSLLGLSSWLEDEEPQKREQIKRFRAQLREQMPGLRQSFESLSFFHAAEASPHAPQNSQQTQQLTQYLPTMLHSLGYPVEILVRHDEEDPQNPGSQGTDVQLTVQTHTLGQLYLSLRFSGSKLQIRIGLERREIQRWLNPYLEALQQKLENLPWSIGSVQTYVMPQEQSGAPLLAHHLYKKYGRSAIEGI